MYSPRIGIGIEDTVCVTRLRALPYATQHGGQRCYELWTFLSENTLPAGRQPCTVLYNTQTKITTDLQISADYQSELISIQSYISHSTRYHLQFTVVPLQLLLLPSHIFDRHFNNHFYHYYSDTYMVSKIKKNSNADFKNYIYSYKTTNILVHFHLIFDLITI